MTSLRSAKPQNVNRITWPDLSNIDGYVNSVVMNIFFLQITVGTTIKNKYLLHQTLFFTIKQHLRNGRFTSLN